MAIEFNLPQRVHRRANAIGIRSGSKKLWATRRLLNSAPFEGIYFCRSPRGCPRIDDALQVGYLGSRLPIRSTSYRCTYQQIESGYTANDEHSFTCSSAATQTHNHDSDGSQSLEILSIITGSTGESIEKGPAAPVVTETI